MRNFKNMEKYELKINGMHCNACKILVTEELEENGFQNIEVNLNEGLVVFSDTDGLIEVENKVKNVFIGLDQYKVVDIKLIS